MSQEEINEMIEGGAVIIPDDNTQVIFAPPEYYINPASKKPKRPWRRYNNYRPGEPEAEQVTIQVDDSFDWASSNESTKAALAKVPMVALYNEIKQKHNRKSDNSVEKIDDILEGESKVDESKFKLMCVCMF